MEETNLKSFLWMLRQCEGTAGPNGYRTLFGGKLFDDFADHPNKRIPFTQTDGTQNWSTAAGAYQFIHRTWTRLQAKLNLPDFGPESQDEAATELIAEAGAMSDVKEGNLQSAIDKCSGIWASLPSSRYLQPKRTLAFAQDAYEDAGGEVA